MTRVLMTTDTVGGVWTFALELADALAPHGVEIQLATMGPRMTADQKLAVTRSAVAAVHESDFALEWMPDPWADVNRAGDWLLALADEVRPDLVHLNGYVHASLPWPAPTVVVAHSCVLSWWRAVHGRDAPGEWSTYAERVRAGLHAADAVVAPTGAMLDTLRDCYGVAGGHVVPNCRHTGWVRPTAKERVVVGTGRVWDEAKNLALLQAAAPRIAAPVVIAGPRATDDPAGTLGWPQLAELLLRASVFVAPARYEPFGLGALEAAQAGCALVLGDIASLREVWGDAAVYVDPDDAGALVTVVNDLLDDAERRALYADRARSRASRFTPEATARGYLGVYRRLPVRAGSG